MVIVNRPSKMKFFWCQGFFFVNFDFKNGCKMNLRIITKNLAPNSKIRSPLKSILEPIGLTSPTRQPGSLALHKNERRA